jgi:hypothetical protein
VTKEGIKNGVQIKIIYIVNIFSRVGKSLYTNKNQRKYMS